MSMEESWRWGGEGDQQHSSGGESGGDGRGAKGGGGFHKSDQGDAYDASSRFRGEGGSGSYLRQLHEQDPQPPTHGQPHGQQPRFDMGPGPRNAGFGRQDYPRRGRFQDVNPEGQPYRDRDRDMGRDRDRDRGFGGPNPNPGFRNKAGRGGYDQPPPSHFHNSGPPGRGMNPPRHMGGGGGGGFEDHRNPNPSGGRFMDRGGPRFRDRDQGPGFEGNHRHHAPHSNGQNGNGRHDGRFENNWNDRPGPPSQQGRFQGFNGPNSGRNTPPSGGQYDQHHPSQFMGNQRQFGRDGGFSGGSGQGRNMGHNPSHGGPGPRDRDFGPSRGGHQGGGFNSRDRDRDRERGNFRREGGFNREEGRFKSSGGMPGQFDRDDGGRFDNRGPPGPGRFERGPPNPRFQGSGGPGPDRFQNPPPRMQSRNPRGAAGYGVGDGGPSGTAKGFNDREFEPRKKELPMTTGSAFQQGRPSTHRSNRDREDQFLMQRSAKSEGSTRPTSILFGVEKRGADGKIIGPPDLPDDEDLVRHLCSRFGEIRSIRKFGDNWMIVTFYDTKPVDMAFRELNGKPWKGAEGIIRVKSRIKHGNNLGGSGGAKEYNSRGDFSSRGSYNVHSEYRKQHRHPIGPTCSIWVAYEAVQKTEDGGHTEALEEDELVQLFSKFGEIHSTKCDGRKLFSFVNFAAVESAEAAFEAFRKGEIDTRDRKMKMKWGYPPPNHPLHEEISKLEDERYARNENKFQAVTQPANNLYDRVARAIEAEKQNEKERRDQELKKRQEERKKAEEERQKLIAEREAPKPRKKKVVVIGTSADKLEKTATTETKPKEAPKEEPSTANATPTHKADAFARKVIELLNNCAGNWRDFISELGRQKLNVRENANHLFDLYICGAIVEGPETLYIPESVHSHLNVFQADFPDFVELPSLAAAQSATATELGSWKRVFKDSESLGLEKLGLDEKTDVAAAANVKDQAKQSAGATPPKRLGLEEYVDLFVQTRRRLRYTATQLEASLLRYCNLAVALPRPICDRIAVFIGMLLGSSIGTQGTSGLLFPLANALYEDRLTQQHRSARMFAMIAQSFLSQGKSADLTKILGKGKLNTYDAVVKIMPEGQRSAFKLAEFLATLDVPLTHILKAESLLRMQKEVAAAAAKSCYAKIAACVRSGEVAKASLALTQAAKQVAGTRAINAEDGSVEGHLKLSIMAAYAAIFKHCTTLDNEALADHIYLWAKVLKQCEMVPYDHVVDGRERTLLDTIYAICTSDDSPTKELETILGDDLAACVECAPLLTERLLLLLHPLYDTDDDVISEDTILKWFEETVKPGSPKVCAQVTEYINWLKNAEEEDDTEDED